MNKITIARDSFKLLNPLMALSFRLGLGPLCDGRIEPLGHIMILTTADKLGRKHRAPVNFAIVRGEVYCTAGWGHAADWYQNVLTNPRVEVWIGNQRWNGRAEPISAPHEYLPIYRQVLVNSGLAAQALAGLDPRTASNEKLLELVVSSPLVRIKIERALSGVKGPADLLWIWPALGATLALATLWQLRQRK